MNARLVEIFKSETFKKATIIFGGIFIVATIFISLNPEPFLKFGYLGVFVFNLLSGPGMLLIPALSKHMNIVALAFVSALGMAFNDTVSWVVGKNGHVVLPKSEKVKRIKNWINRFGPWALFVWSMIPFPYDLIGLIAGYLGFDYLKFLVPTFMGKFIRFLLIAGGSLAIFKFL